MLKNQKTIKKLFKGGSSINLTAKRFYLIVVQNVLKTGFKEIIFQVGNISSTKERLLQKYNGVCLVSA